MVDMIRRGVLTAAVVGVAWLMMAHAALCEPRADDMTR